MALKTIGVTNPTTRRAAIGKRSFDVKNDLTAIVLAFDNATLEICATVVVGVNAVAWFARNTEIVPTLNVTP